MEEKGAGEEGDETCGGDGSDVRTEEGCSAMDSSKKIGGSERNEVDSKEVEDDGLVEGE